ncbi:hypothetical protein J3R80_07095 [Aliiroseovarius sp. Z3]|uniref:hypothetical protein n=1 Tax=Aliiroseovarius sp. Z3 TaxID=2811402 RepID=UPI0023B2D659|nr:hypothetical protein [Aliiroseovarius sp. Z3]MDE9450235.1 hypothetical protein [Aliiroseovarius sp. Z3]
MRLLLIIGTFIGVTALVLWGAARAFEAAEAQRVTYRYIAAALAPVDVGELYVTWNAPDVPLVRPFTQADATVISRALGEAWQVLAVAQESGNPNLLADRFTGIAAERSTLSVRDATAHGGRMIVLSQRATPMFYHKDGSLFQARIEMVVARYLSHNGATLDAMEVTRDTGVATLLNDSNGWRVMSWERRTSQTLDAPRVTFEGRLAGVNYYPAETPWRDFWLEFDATDVARDFDRIAGLNGNAVRIFLTRDAFIGARADASLDSLARLLAVAEEKSLRVVPTLFDLKQDYSVGTWGGDALYLSRVLRVLDASPAVAFIDLKNEPDLDFEAHGEAKVLAWLTTMLGLSRSIDARIPLSIGWSSAEAANALIEDVDVVTYHDYAPLEGAAERLDALRALADGKPIYVTEIGESSYSLVAGFPGTEAKQAKRLSERLDALREADGIMVWTLYDFPNVDPSVVGASPWVRRLQSSFGILRVDGTEKPGAASLRDGFAGRG